jgi:DNA-binding beta-propeller fold protein YncE
MTIGTSGIPGSDNNHFGEIVGPGYMAVDKNGNLYVSDHNPNTRVQIFDSSGNYKGTIGVTGFVGTDNEHLYAPCGISLDSSGNIFISDFMNHRVQVFDENRNYVDTIGITGFTGSDNEHFNMPRSVGISPVNNKIYVVDMVNHRVQIFKK